MINSPVRNFPRYSDRTCYSDVGKDSPVMCVYQFETDIQTQLVEEYDYTDIDLESVTNLYPYLDTVDEAIQNSDLLDVYREIKQKLAKLGDYYYIYDHAYPDGETGSEFELYYYDVDLHELYYFRIY